MAERSPVRLIDRTPPWIVANVAALAFDTANGRLLVATRRDIRALSLESGREVLRFESDGRANSDHSFCIGVPAKRAVAIAQEELIAWDTSTGAILSRARVPGALWLDSISDDGTKAVLGHPVATDPAVPIGRAFLLNMRMTVVDIATGEVRMDLGEVQAGTPRATILLPDGGLILLERLGGIVEYDARAAIVRRHPPLPPDLEPDAGPQPAPVEGVVDPMRNFGDLALLDGDVLLYRSFSESVVRHRVSGERAWRLGRSMMEAMIVSADRKSILRRASSPGQIELRHDARTGAVEALSGYGVIEWNLGVEENGVLATADYAGAVRVSRRGQRQNLAIPLDVIPSQPESIAISPDGETVIVGCYDGSLRLLEGDRIRALPGHTGQAGAAGFLEDGRMWTSSADHHRVWSRSGRIEIDEIFLGSTYGNPTTTPSGKLIFGVRDASVTVRSTETGRVVRDRVLGATNIRDGGGLLEDGTTFFGLTEHGVFRWNLESGEQTASLEQPQFQDEPFWQSFSAVPNGDGSRVLLHTFGASTMIWEPDGGRLVTIPRVRSVSRARWRGNQLLLLGAHEDDPADITPETRIHVVDATTLERLDVLTGPREPIRTFAIAGPFVCAVSEDRKISIWRHAA